MLCAVYYLAPQYVYKPSGNEAPIDNTSTHAAHNPLQPAIPHRDPVQRKSGRSAQTSRALNHEKAVLLQRDINSLMQDINARIEQMSKDHGKSQKHIRSLVTNEIHFKSSREVNLQNALVHFKTKELNDGREEDEELMNLSPEHKQEILQEFKEYKDMKHSGARASNKAAVIDYRDFVSKVQYELDRVAQRTGCAAFAFFTCGHVNDTMYPCWIDTNKSVDFCTEILGVTPGEVARKFDNWSCARTKSGTKETLQDLQKECGNMIADRLNKILGKKSLAMNYQDYDSKIHLKYCVQLHGWPVGIKCGECTWVKIERAEYEKLVQSMKGRPQKKRKTRSDKGVSRGSRHSENRDSDGDEDANPRSKKKSKAAAKVPPMVRSTSYVYSDEESSDVGS
ncbi:hypothetical protein BDQ17DRAFT_1433146 [Cyathus striatus]|nr:hypothetical protein BDQ17DRAFT_1433146 [Cyathus striatus]